MSVTSAAMNQIIKDLYLPTLKNMLNTQSILLTALEGDRSRAAALAEHAERLTLILAGGAQETIPAELEEVGHILGFHDGAQWALPAEHPLAA